MEPIASPEFDTFVDKVDEVHSLIQGLQLGTVSPNDPRIQRLTNTHTDTVKQSHYEESKEQIPEQPLFRSGHGAHDNYEAFCQKCRAEFLVEVVECSQCHGSVISRHDRQRYLKQRVEALKTAKAARADRRARFAVMKNRQTDTLLPSAAWADYEPSSEEDDDLTTANPNFAALEADYERRAEVRRANERRSDQARVTGNSHFHSGDYDSAIECYTQAIALHRTNKSLYTNRALARFRRHQYDQCVTDCTDCIDIWRLLESGEENFQQSTAKLSDVEIVIKAYLRRIDAYIQLKKFTEADSDCRELEPLCSKELHQSELRKVRRRVRQEMAEHEKESKIVNDAQSMKSMIEALLQCQSVTLANDCREIVRSDDGRVMFRSQGGIEAVIAWLEHHTRTNSNARPTQYAAVLSLLSSVLVNDRNKTHFTEHGGLDLLLPLLTDEKLSQSTVVQLFAQLTEDSTARKSLLRHSESFLATLVDNVRTGSKSTSLSLSSSLSVLANLAFDKSWKPLLASPTLSLLPVLVPCLDNQQSLPVLSALFSLLSNLLTVQSVRAELLGSDMQVMLASLLKVTVWVFDARHDGDRWHEVQARVVAAWVNLTSNKAKSPQLQSQIDVVILQLQPFVPLALQWMERTNSQAAVSSLTELVRCRLLALLSQCCIVESIRAIIANNDGLSRVWQSLQREIGQQSHTKPRVNESDDDDQLDAAVLTIEHALRIIAQCKSSTTAAVVHTDSRARSLAALLSSPSHFIAGNAALLLSQLALDSSLIGTPAMSAAVMPLLDLLRRCVGKEGLVGAAAKNAAIALARLAPRPQHLAVIRTNNGLAMMAQAAKSS